MDEHNKLVAYVLDEPEGAALELARLRKDNALLRDRIDDYERTSTPGWCVICVIVALIVGVLFV